MKIVGILFAIVIFCLTSSLANLNPAGAIQILAPINHTFHLDTDILKPILESNGIKDRQVVIVSIAGVFRQGKSFLLNFFLKFLYAQYKTHDTSDWIGEKSNGTGLDGFKWRAGRKRETVGIWMWSEIFTHDSTNGDKFAIILLDTQGIFDDQSSVRDCTTIFALSMMLSSVQLYNLKHNIREDDLQNLELFAEYGRLVLEQTDEKPFQKLLFIVRDWPFAFETDYGWNGQEIIDENLAGNDKQTPEMRQLRQRIRSSFEEISAFLMPFPGLTVAHGNSFIGDLQQISADFITYVKEFVPAVFAPENLISKRINGQTIRARDLLQFLETYVNAFNADKIPEPKSIFMATAEVTNMIKFYDSMNVYMDLMRNAIKKVEYCSEKDLEKVHLRTIDECMTKYLEKPQFGGAEIAFSFRQKFEDSVNEKFRIFKTENEKKRQSFIKRAYSHIENISNEVLLEQVKQKILNEIDGSNSTLTYSHLNTVFSMARQAALQEFDSRKIDDEQVASGFRGKLERDLNEFQLNLGITMEEYHLCLQHYKDKMQASLDAADYFGTLDLAKLHQNVKNEVISQFRSKPGDHGIKFSIQSVIEQKIDERFHFLEGQNGEKRRASLEKANWHSGTVIKELKTAFENSIWTEISEQHLDDSEFFSLFMRKKEEVLKEFASKKMGEDEISIQEHQSSSIKLENDLNSLQAPLKQLRDCLNLYSEKMQESLNAIEYFSSFDLVKLHQNVKNEAITKFRSKPGDYELKFNLQPKIESRIDEKFSYFAKLNGEKTNGFRKTVNWYSENVRKEIKTEFENKMRKLISEKQMDVNELNDELMSAKRVALKEFSKKKMGENEISHQIYHDSRDKLERDLNDLQLDLKKLITSNEL